MSDYYFRHCTQGIHCILKSHPYLYPSLFVSGIFVGAFFTDRFISSLPPPIFNPSKPCRFRLDTDSSSTFTLPDGRALGYAQYGDLTGKPVLYMHGLPGSRMEGAYFEDLGKKYGVRIVTMDRPGYGLSDQKVGRTVRDWARDVECLVKHLGLEEYAVLGVSGGGPYALACAAFLAPQQLKCVSTVCGLGPPDIGMRGAAFMHRITFVYGSLYSPLFLIRWFFQSEPGGRLDLSDSQRLTMLLSRKRLASIKNPKDRRILSDEDFCRVMLRSNRESFKQGFEGVQMDGRAMCGDWGFNTEDIRKDLPIRLWYGRLDQNVPVQHGVEIERRLGGIAKLRVEDEDTHASIFFDWREEVLKEIVDLM